MLAAIGETLEKEGDDEVMGVVVNARKGFYRIGLWTKSCSNQEVLKAIGYILLGIRSWRQKTLQRSSQTRSSRFSRIQCSFRLWESRWIFSCKDENERLEKCIINWVSCTLLACNRVVLASSSFLSLFLLCIGWGISGILSEFLFREEICLGWLLDGRFPMIGIVKMGS